MTAGLGKRAREVVRSLWDASENGRTDDGGGEGEHDYERAGDEAAGLLLAGHATSFLRS